MSCIFETQELLAQQMKLAGRNPGSVTIAHHDHLHIDLDPTRDRLAAVLHRFTHNQFEEMASIYLMGRPDELVPLFQARIDAGIEELTFNFMTPDPAQLELFMTRIRPNLRLPISG
jgi:hypothetical protein